MFRSRSPRWGLLMLWLMSCGTSEKDATVAITTGLETEVLTRAPAPKTLVVSALDKDGVERELASTSLPATNLDLGNVDIGTVLRLQVKAKDAQGKVLVAGRSTPLSAGARERVPVFVQRNGELARLPSPFATAPLAPLVEVVFGRYLFLAAAGSASTQVYDFETLAPLPAAPTLPLPAQTIVAQGANLYVVGAGVAAINVATGVTLSVTAPSEPGDVAGAVAVHGDNGTAYVVGATRASDTATDRGWFLAADGRLALRNLGFARAHAVAAFVAGKGLFVTSAGAPPELVSADSTTPLGFPAPTARLLAAAPLDDRTVLVVDADGLVSRYDVTCRVGCVVEVWAPGPKSTRASIAAIDTERALYVGDDGAAILTRGERRPLALREARSDARVFPLPTLGLGVVGGARTLESFIP